MLRNVFHSNFSDIQRDGSHGHADSDKEESEPRTVLSNSNNSLSSSFKGTLVVQFSPVSPSPLECRYTLTAAGVRGWDEDSKS